MDERTESEKGTLTPQQLMAKMDSTDAEKILQLYLEAAAYEESNTIFDADKAFFGDMKKRCEWIFDNADIDFQNCFAVGVTIGGLPEIVSEKEKYSFQEFILTTYAFYNRIVKEFKEQGIGFEIHRTAHMLHMMGVFKKEHSADFVSRYIQPLHHMIEETYQVKVCIGIGIPVHQRDQLYNAFRTAQYSREFYFFRQQPIITFQSIVKNFERSPDDYPIILDESFRAILMKDPDALKKIIHAVNVIAEMHFGNWQAVLMRIMFFTGDLTGKLFRYKLLQGDFFQIQDNLQAKILNAKTLKQAKSYVREYYTDILEHIYHRERGNSKMVIDQVKTYIQENFMEDISITKLSEVACVSPNYFSHMFKNETGQNYKDYLTQIRMEHAIELVLNTDYPLYRIAESVGYNNTRTFVDAFKSIYGESPTKYKKKLIDK